ncbi:unnamed protein product [Mytilus edulis]|uniref:Reverse transcriptase domain-containing protein n=1 Tax=Mytilus edulis TaxID=6550 RepID=A0A8S3TTK5_MYTED|nr:unnamed protein product [Mytilus edulis]
MASLRFNLIFLILIPAGLTENCPNGWLIYDSSCYLISQTSVDWADSVIGLEKIMQTTCKIMANSAIKSSNIKPSYNAKPKLKVLTPAIQIALKEMRNSYNAWVNSEKHEDLYNVLFLEKRRTKQQFRKTVRVEIAKRREDEKELIMETRTRNMKLFHRLVRNTHKKGGEIIMDLNVNGHCYTGDENILAGFKEHFRTLATYDENINIDNDYHQNVEHEILIINQLVKGKNIPDASREEFSNAIKKINKGKSADYYGITIEHIVNAGEIIVILLQSIINEIFQQGYVPDLLKIGLLTPIFKNKGSKNDATNYRGITVLPVVSKIIVLKNRTQPSVKAVQHKYQRGSTSGSGPMNSALPVEEVYREVHDGETEAQIMLLDTKSALDKVIHSHMMRRVYQAGIEDKHWSLISSLHQNAASTIKWGGNISESHRIKMYENETDPMCLICHQGDETLEHFILECEGLSDTRNSIMDEVSAILKGSINVDFHEQTSKVKMQILLDITMLRENLKLDTKLMAEIEYCSRRLLFLLHTTRYSFLSKGWKKDKKNVKV